MEEIQLQAQQIFTDEQIKDLASFFGAIERVNRRLLREGFTMIDGALTPPSSETMEPFDHRNLIG